MTAQEEEKFITEAEYEALEAPSPIRHEYFRGQIYSLHGVGGRHSNIITNFGCLLHERFSGTPLFVGMCNQRVFIELTGLYTYPDIVVASEPAKYSDLAQYNLVNPVLVAEVLSDSTRNYDCGGKLEQYRQIPSLQHIVLADSDRVMVTHWKKLGSQWLGEQFFYREQELNLNSVNVKLTLEEIYRDVDLPQGLLLTPGPESRIRIEDDSKFF